LDNHHTPEGRLYRRIYDALKREHGPFDSETVRFQAGRVSAFEVNLTASAQALDAAQRQRAKARGRPPSERRIERLSGRVGLDDAGDQPALECLREMTAASRKPLTLAEALSRRQAGGA